jgi:phosphoribosyl-ATP pyrophosphohydrolase
MSSLTVNEYEDRSRRINQKMVEEGGELEERAKRLIEKL